MKTPIKFLPYQQSWIDDRSRLAIINKARQVGITFATAWMDVASCMRVPGTRWYYLSTNEERAKDAMEDVARHARCAGYVADMARGRRSVGGVDCQVLRARWPNGSRVIGLPANPATARGCHGNVVLDEFAHHIDPEGIYRALYPCITRGYSLRIISTPNGKQGPFHDIYSNVQKYPQWSRHEVDIHTAVAQGLQVDIEQLRSGCLYEEDWLQEYCCEFLDEAHAWIPYKLIDSRTTPHATLEMPPNGVHELYGGMDIGRRHDRTVIWLLNRTRDGELITCTVHVLNGEPFNRQRQVVERYLRKGVRRLCVDATGIGAQLGEELARDWGSTVEPITISAPVQARLAGLVKGRLEGGELHLPACRDVRRDLHAIRKEVTPAGNVRFTAPRGRHGHADRFWALGLALLATDQPVAQAGYEGGGGRDYSGFVGPVDWSDL